MADDIKSIVNAGIERAARDLTERLQTLGFSRTRKWYWVRLHENSADFIHLYRSGSSYGAPSNNSVSFRVHCGYRALNDPTDFLALNGPNSDLGEYRDHRFHLRFNAKSGSTYDRCITDLERFVVEIGEPWYLLERSRENNDKEIKMDNIQHSRELLGIKA